MGSVAEYFELKIGLESEKEFKSQLKEIDASFKVPGSEMKPVEIHFEKNGNPVEALTIRNEALELSGAVFFWTVLKKRLRAGPSDPDHGIFREIT